MIRLSFFVRSGRTALRRSIAGERRLGLGEVGIDDDRERAAVRQLDPLEHRARVGQQLLEDPVDPAGVAPALGRLLGLYRVQLLEDLDRYGQVVLLEFVNRLRVVNQDIRIQHERLYLCRDPDPRIWRP